MSLLRLGNMLRDKRGGRGVREVAEDIGISPATLSRVEGGKLPDILTFRKLCTWLKVDPADILEMQNQPPMPVAAVHFRADVLLSPEAASDMAQLILAAHSEVSRRTRENPIDVSTWF
jgi:DNA-binding Xre family transcriptional regulator